MKCLTAIVLIGSIVTSESLAQGDMERFKGLIKKSEDERARAADRERPLYKIKDSRAKQCILDAADELATTSKETSDIVAIVAFARCRDAVDEAMKSAAVIFSTIPYERWTTLKSEWRNEWTQRAMVRIVEKRAAKVLE